MPVHIRKDNDGCFAQWGEHGSKYYYQCGNNNSQVRARAKAYNQGVAEIISDQSKLTINKGIKEKISFDFDGTLTQKSNRETAINYISNGNIVYIISARNDVNGMYAIADKLRIPHSRVFATGSNEAKIKKIKELGIDKHYDNNQDVINELGKKGIKV